MDQFSEILNNYKKDNEIISYDNRQKNNLNYIIKYKLNSKIDYLTVFNKLKSSSIFPYISFQKYTKYNIFSNTPKFIYNSFTRDNSSIYFIYNYDDEDLNLDNDIIAYNKEKGFFFDINYWYNKQKKVLNVLTDKLDISENSKIDIDNFIKTWNNISNKLLICKININEDNIEVSVNIKSNDTDYDEIKIKENLKNLIQNSNFNEENILSVEKIINSYSYVYNNTNVNSDILIDIIMNNKMFMPFIYVKESSKLKHVNNKKGIFRIDFILNNNYIKCTLKSGFQRKQPFLILNIKDNNYGNVYFEYITNLFGILLGVYKREYSNYIAEYINIYKELKTNLKIDDFVEKCDLVDCQKGDCKQYKCGICNPVVKKCSKNIKNIISDKGYSVKCSKKEQIPIIIDKKDVVKKMNEQNYITEELPKNEDLFFSCLNKKYKYPYLIKSGEKYLPCCAQKDHRLEVDSNFNKYYRNLDKININKDNKISLIFEESNKEKVIDDVKKIIKFSKDFNLSVIGIYENNDDIIFFKLKNPRKLSSGPVKIDVLDNILNKQENEIIKTAPKDPIGALHIIIDTIKNKFKLIANIYLESDKIEKKEIKKDIYRLLKPLEFTYETTKKTMDNILDTSSTVRRLKYNKTGPLPDDILILLNVLETSSRNKWKRIGVSQSNESNTSFLNCLEHASVSTYMKSDEIRKKLNRLYNIFNKKKVPVCPQSFYNIESKRIDDIFSVDSTDYLNPSLLHDICQTIYNFNIVLFNRDRNNNITFLLPKHFDQYKSELNSERYIFIYQHYGSNVDKFLNNPVCELIYKEVNDEKIFYLEKDEPITEKIYKNWFNSEISFSKNTRNTFFENSIDTVPLKDLNINVQINNYGKINALSYNSIIMSTQNLPNILVPYNKSYEELNYETFNTSTLKNLLKKLNKEKIFSSKNIYDYNYYNYDGDFEIKINSYRNKTNKINKFIEYKKNSSMLKGYLLFAFSDLFMSSSTDNLYDLLDIFMNDILDFKKNDQKIVISNILPPPQYIYNKYNKKFFINYDVFIQKQEDIEDLTKKIRYFLLHNIKTNYNKTIFYKDNTFITDIYDSLDSFDTYKNENIIDNNHIIKFSSYYNLYDQIINKKDITYFWRNSKNDIFVSYNSNNKNNIVNYINNITKKKEIEISRIDDLYKLTNDKIFIYQQQNYLDIVEEEEIVDLKLNKKVLRVKNVKEPLLTVIVSLKLI